jgi:TRAP transporter TAXI family solute receptor
VPLEEELIEAMVRDRPFYRRVTIPGGVYPGNPTPVATFATDALLVASTTTPVELVHEVVEAVLADLPGFRRLHLAFAGVTAESLVPDGRLLPLHDGAERYFRRSGLV